MKVIIDSREQLPYSFDGLQCQIEHKWLASGDYSIEGYEDNIAIERKSVNDLLGCLTKDRARFERELSRLSELERAYVVVECTFDDIQHGKYRSKMVPKSALQSIFAFMARYGVPFLFCQDRQGGEYTTFSLLEKYEKEQRKHLDKNNGKAIASPHAKRADALAMSTL